MTQKYRGLITALLIIQIFLIGQVTGDETPQAEKDGLVDPNFIVDDDLLVKVGDGIALSVLLVRPKHQKAPLPVAMQFTIYAQEERNKDIKLAIAAAKRGYASVIAYARGKHKSKSEIIPYKVESQDVNAIIDWAAKQPWSNGKVGMYGGSYGGFSQWSALKSFRHPALKTIVPYVAALPGLGLPMENNVFINANYGWPFYVGNGPYNDDSIYQQRDRWNDLNEDWFLSGKAYNQLDSFDIRENSYFRESIKHPAFDEHWQAPIPFREEYQHIDIPVLSITGYYDDGQISALHYLNQHYKHNDSANHYLVIGPYDHWTAQSKARPTLRGTALDPKAIIDISKLTFDWLDFVLKGEPRPKLLQDKINYQVMGENTWRHAASMEALQTNKKSFYLTPGSSQCHRLSLTPDNLQREINHVVDLADRTKQNNYYPWPIETPELDVGEGVAYCSEKFDSDWIISGQFSADLHLRSNKKDLDVVLTVYEQKASGEYFHLSYFIGRASYAKDMTKRKLLVPGAIEQFPVARTRMISKKVSKGSRLVFVININKNSFAQLNYGTGKDVSLETIRDAGDPLEIDWLSSSTFHIPMTQLP